MKKFKLVEETHWMLTQETKADKNLNAVDLNLLAILQYIEDGKATHGDWFRVLIKHPNGKWNEDGYTSIEKNFADWDVPTTYSTLNRSVNKLQRLGYIDYKTGWYNNTTGQGMTPMVRILKGTIPIKCSDIAIAKGFGDVAVNSEQLVNSEKITTYKSATCSDIAIAYEKEKEKYKESYNLSSIEHNIKTYTISDFSADDDDLYLTSLGVDKLSTMLQNDVDWLTVLQYLEDHPTKANYDKIEAYWQDNPENLQYLYNLNNNKLKLR